MSTYIRIKLLVIIGSILIIIIAGRYVFFQNNIYSDRPAMLIKDQCKSTLSHSDHIIFNVVSQDAFTVLQSDVLGLHIGIPGNWTIDQESLRSTLEVIAFPRPEASVVLNQTDQLNGESVKKRPSDSFYFWVFPHACQSVGQWEAVISGEDTGEWDTQMDANNHQWSITILKDRTNIGIVKFDN